MKVLRVFVAAVIGATAAFALPAMAQNYPEKPVKIVLPFPAGTGPDAVMRIVGEKLSNSWGQPVIVDNRPGANGWTAVDVAKKAAPDGYTLFQADNLLVGMQPFVFKQMPFDPIKDLDPVAALYETYFFVVVPVDSPWKTIPDLFAAAKQKDGMMAYGSSGVASHMHLGGAMMERASGAKMTHVPVKDTPQVFILIAQGQLGWSFGTASTSGPMVKAQKVKYLAVAAPKRVSSFPDVPTIAEAGGPSDLFLKSWVALFAPHGTPKAIVDKINADVAKALAEPDVKEKLAAVGFQTWTATPSEIAKTIQDDQKVFSGVAKENNITLD